VIAMATPFLRLKPRHIQTPLAIVSRVLGFLGFFFALGALLELGMTFSSSLPIFYGWKAVVAALIFLVGGLALIRLLLGTLVRSRRKSWRRRSGIGYLRSRVASSKG